MNDQWIYDQNSLKNMALSYYRDLFTSNQREPRQLQTVSAFPPLNSTERDSLSSVISSQEIKEAVFQMGRFKAPGPDGIQAFFYQDFWTIVGNDVCDLVRDCSVHYHKIVSLNNTNLVLIPKKDVPERIKDFRPISLCNVSYKVITKVISLRLRSIMNKVVGKHQCSFIAGRQSSDNIIIAQEVIHSMRDKRGSKGWMAVKVDLEKAYDRLEWPFIHDTLKRVGIEERMCQLIMACITSATFSVLWNGDRTEGFKASRGIRQGDPISPYIFTLCMERLSHLVTDAIAAEDWQPISLTRHGPPISHLFFADDLILFGEASSSQVDCMMGCVNQFCEASGQKMNKEKTRVCFSRNVHFSRATNLSSKMGVGPTGDLGKYLGIPLIHKRASYPLFAPILNKVQNRLSGWQGKYLNIAGRATLIKSVLDAIPSYYMQTILLPKRLLHELERTSKGFLWGDNQNSKKVHLIAWQDIIKEK